MSNAICERNENLIIKKVCEVMIRAGYSVSVFDGEEVALSRSTDIEAVLKEVRATEEEALFIWNGKQRIGTITLIYWNGNNGLDVISDHSMSDVFDPLMKKVDEYIEQLDEQQY